MSVLNAVAKIIRARIISIIIYAAIPLVITLMVIQTYVPPESEYINSPVDLHVFNYDAEDPIALALENQIVKDNTVVTVEDEPKAIADALFYEADYILKIPQNFGAELMKQIAVQDLGNDTANLNLPLERHVGMQQNKVQRIDYQIANFLSTLDLYQSLYPDDTPQQLAERISTALNRQATVEMVKYEGQTGNELIFYFFRFATFGLLAAIYFIIAQVFKTMTTFELRRRTACAPVNISRHSLSVFVSAALFSLGIFMLFIIGAALMFGAPLFTPTGLLLVLNFFIFFLVSVCMSFMISTILPNDSEVIIDMVGNSVPLALSFLGGIFTPVSWQPDWLQKITAFIPNSWNSKVIESLTSTPLLTDAVKTDVTKYMLIQLIFCIAFIVLALALNRAKSGQNNHRKAARLAYEDAES